MVTQQWRKNQHQERKCSWAGTEAEEGVGYRAARGGGHAQAHRLLFFFVALAQARVCVAVCGAHGGPAEGTALGTQGRLQLLLMSAR